MVSNVTGKAYVKGVEVYSHAPEFNRTAGKEKRDINIPLQVWQERAGKAMNILQEKVRFKVDPAKGGVVMETGSNNGGAGKMTGNAGPGTDGVIHPGRGAKGFLINSQG